MQKSLDTDMTGYIIITCFKTYNRFSNTYIFKLAKIH